MVSSNEVVYRLTKEEKKVLVYEEKPFVLNGVRVTKPVIAAFDKSSGNLLGLSTLKQWRTLCREVNGFIDTYRFELRNIW